MSKYAIYARKSSEAEDRQVLSIDSQIKEMTDLVSRLGIKFPDILQESKSAKYTGRPGFSELIEKIENEVYTSILVWHPDRLSRNPQDSAKLITLMDSGYLQEVITPSQTFRNNPMDKFMLGFFMMQAKLENDNKSENVKRGLKAKAEKGWLPSGAKPGYMNDKYAEKGNKTILPDPIRFSIMHKAWEMMLTGTYTVAKILEIVNNDCGYRSPIHKRIGGKPLCRSMLYRIFTDPFYYGDFEYPTGSDTWHKGKHKPMISKGEFDHVQQLLGRKGRPRPKNLEFDYSGLLNCGECRGAITAEEKWQIICPVCKTKFASKNKDECIKCKLKIEEMINPTLLHYIYYHCTKRKNPNCSQKSIRVEDLEQQINDLLSRIQISERFKTWAIKHLNEVNDQEVDIRNSVIESLDEAYKNCVQRIDNLVKLKISPQNSDGSLLSDEEFKGQKSDLLREKSDLEEKKKEAGLRISHWIKLTEESFNLACYAKYRFENGSVQEKRELLYSLGSNLTLNNKTLSINLQKPLYFLEQTLSEVEEISGMFEPAKKGVTEAQMEDFYSKNPTLLPG
jgi:site-specific DNA recombinase